MQRQQTPPAHASDKINLPGIEPTNHNARSRTTSNLQLPKLHTIKQEHPQTREETRPTHNTRLRESPVKGTQKP